MIQRIQTVWLLVASLTLFLLFLFPYLQYFDNFGTAMVIKVTGIYQGVSEGVIQAKSFILQTIVTVVLALLPLVTIFNYKDRKKQLQICYLNIFLVLLLGIWFYVTSSNAVAEVNKTLAIENIGIGALLAPLDIVFLFLAAKGIRNDEKLIKSVDRLRG
jgi:hypothetical protein